MNIEEIDKINHLHHTLKNVEISTKEAELIEYLRSIEVDQPLTSQNRQAISDLYNEYNLQEES